MPFTKKLTSHCPLSGIHQSKGEIKKEEAQDYFNEKKTF
jgi:hypothetical protein